MAGKGTLESLAVLAVCRSIAEQFIEQSDMTAETPLVRETVNAIISHTDEALLEWSASLEQADFRRIENKISALEAGTIPMDRPVSMHEATGFIIALLEKLMAYVSSSRKRLVGFLIQDVMRLHAHFEGDRNEALTDKMDMVVQSEWEAARSAISAASAWNNIAII